MLAGQKPPKGCATCGRTMEQISADAARRQNFFSPGVHSSPARRELEVRKMFAHAIDGLYVLLCPSCSDRIEQLQRFTYKETPYGRRKGLI